MICYPLVTETKKGIIIMEKIKKIAGFLETFAKVGLRIFLVCAVIILVAAVVLAFLGDAVYEEATVSVGIGAFSFTIAEGFLPEPSAVRARLVAGLIFASVCLAFVAYALDVVRKILTPMKEGRPFDNDVAVNIRKLSWTYLIGAVLYSVGMLALQVVVFQCYDLQSLFMSEKIIGVDIDYDLNIATHIAVFGTLQLMSYVFHHSTYYV